MGKQHRAKRLLNVSNYLKESKAVKTTVIVVGAIVLCLIPPGFAVVLGGFGVGIFFVFSYCKSFFRIAIMLN